jgi:hypothetical protein
LGLFAIPVIVTPWGNIEPVLLPKLAAMTLFTCTAALLMLFSKAKSDNRVLVNSILIFGFLGSLSH